MSLCTVAELRAALGIGTLYTDALLQEVCDAADDVLLPMLWTPTYYAQAKSLKSLVCTLWFEPSIAGIFYIGQPITIDGAGAHFNGSKTITAMTDHSISYAANDHPADQTKHFIQPYASVTTEVTTAWADDSAVQQAATLIAINIWQARSTASGGSVGIDGTPMPFRLGASLMGQIRGLIAHAMAPRQMVV